jgi:hypothetical protein
MFARFGVLQGCARDPSNVCTLCKVSPPGGRSNPVPVRLARATLAAIQHRVRWYLRTKGQPVGGLTPEVDPHPLSEVTP